MKWPLLLLVLLAQPIIAQDVLSVHDGDTFTVQQANGRKTRIRVAGIDCPELNQPYGEEALAETQGLLLGGVQRIHKETTDLYGRQISSVQLADGTDLASTLVLNGAAWWYKGYGHGELEALQSQACKGKLGLWNLRKPTAPWQWRKLRKKHNTRGK